MTWWLVVLLLGTLAHGPRLADAAGMPTNWRFTLPEGRAAAGEQVFVRMECYSCHTVAGKRFGKPGATPGGIGPDLTADYAKLPREYLAESIVNFDRFAAHGQLKRSYLADDGTSRMGDYTDLLSVRELVDLVEFIRNIR
jgi:mono/diheme cytochrome c family protein